MHHILPAILSLPSSELATIPKGSCRLPPAPNAEPRVNGSQLTIDLCGVRPTSGEAAVAKSAVQIPSHKLVLPNRRTAAPDARDADAIAAI